MTDLLATAERVLDLVGTDADAEVTVRAGTSALTRFANAFIHQNVAEEVFDLRLRVSLDGRTASASINQTDDDALRALVSRVTEAARLQPVDAGWPGLAPPAGAPAVEHYDEGTVAASPDARAARVRDFVAAGDGLSAAGYCGTDALTTAYANSAGQRLEARATSATLDGIFRTETSDGSGRRTSVRLDALEGATVGARAASKAREAGEPTQVEPGRYEVILEPYCVANVLSFLAMHGFNGRAVEEGRSFWRLGVGQFDASVNLRDDVEDPISIGLPFDVEGTPKRRVDLVSDGTTVGICHDRRTAKALGAESTGHALEGAATWGALPANLILAPGQHSREQLIAGVQRGLLVTDFWYTRILDPRTQVVTGLTRNGVWLIEDGEIKRPVTNLRFTQSFLDALGPDAVRAIGDDLTLVGGSYGGAYAVPSLHLVSWNFTGGASG